MKELENKIKDLKQKYIDNIENQYATTYEESQIAEVDNSVINIVEEYLEYVNTMKNKAIALKGVAEQLEYNNTRDNLSDLSESISNYETMNSKIPSEILSASREAFDELAHDFDACKDAFIDSIDRAEKHYDSARTYKNKRDSYDTVSEEKSSYYYYNDLYHKQLTQGNADCSDAKTFYESLINMFNSGLKKTSTVVSIDNSLKEEENSDQTEGGPLEEYVLEGDERDEFLSANNIPDEEYIVVKKSSVTVNGVDFPLYKVYDTDCDEDSNHSFEEYIEGCIDYEEKIDHAVLSRIANGGTAFVFEQTYRCDGGSFPTGSFNASAYCNSENRNIVQFFHSDNNYGDYYLRSIVHETGHAYDFTLRYEATGETCCGITAFKSSDSIQEQNKSLFAIDSDGNLLTWDKLIVSEANYFDSSHASTSPCIIPNFDTKEAAQTYFDNYCINGTIEGISYDESSGKFNLSVSYENLIDSNGVTVGGINSVYGVHDYVRAPHEYFADAFRAYYLGDGAAEKPGETSRFEYLCPETYAAMDTLIQKEINNYGG